MSDEKPPNVYSFLRAFNRRLQSEVRGEPGNPTRMWIVRAVVIWLSIGLFGGLFWNAAKHMPTGVWVIVGLGLSLRIGLWYWRRLP